VFVVGATNFIERVDEAVRSRLNKTLAIPLPRPQEIVQLLRLFTEEMTVAPDLDWQAIAQLLQGKSGRDIRQLVSEVGQYGADRLAPNQSLVLTTDHFRAVLEAKSPKGDLTWEDLILPEDTKQELRRLVKLVANYAHLPPGVNLPKGVLLCGPPGTGKTQTARVIASVAGLYFRSYGPGQIRDKYVGQSAKNLQTAFAQARQNSPAILFFDEIESLFPSRGDMGTTSADREDQNLVSQFLQEVDGVNIEAGCVFVFGATNYPERVDEAVRSRLHKQIAIPLPLPEARLKLLEAKIHPDWQLAHDVNLKTYAEQLAGQSGRDIAIGIDTAAQLAFDDWTAGPLVLGDRHFRQAFQHLLVDDDLEVDIPTFESKSEADRAFGQGLELLKANVEEIHTHYTLEAKQLMRGALRFYERHQHFSEEALCCVGLSSTYAERHQYPIGQEFAERAVRLYKNLGDYSGQALAKLFLSGFFFASNHLQKVQNILEECLKFYTDIMNIHGEGTTRFLLSSVYNLLKQYSKAEQTLKITIILYQRSGDALGVACSNFGLGGTYFCIGQYEQAISSAKRAKTIFQEIGHQSGEALALYQISEIYREQGQLEKSIESGEQAHQLLKSQGLDFELDHAMQRLRSSFSNRGIINLLFQQSKEIITIQQQAKVKINTNGKSQKSQLGLFKQSSFLDELAQDNFIQRNYQKAINLCEEALHKSQRKDDQAIQVNILKKLLVSCIFVGQYQKAIDYGNQAIVIYQDLHQSYNQAKTWHMIGGAQLQIGREIWGIGDSSQATEAIKSFEKAINLFQKLDKKQEEIEVILGLIPLLQSLEQPEKAIDYYQRASTLLTKLDSSSVATTILAARLQIRSNFLRDPLVGITTIEDVIPILESQIESFGPGSEHILTAHSLGILGLLYFYNATFLDIGDYLPKAETTLLKAVEAWKSVRDPLKDLNQISSFEILETDLYSALQKVLITQGKKDSALEIAEQGRARALISLLGTVSENFQSAESLKFSEIQQIASDYKITIIEYSIMYGLTAHGAIRRADEEIYIWVVQPYEKIYFRKLDLEKVFGSKSSLNEFINSARDAINSERLNHLANTTNLDNSQSSIPKPNKLYQQDLYELLIEPIDDLLPNDPNVQVVFIPQGPLFLVPFAAIQDKTGRALIDRFNLSIAPSIQTLQLIRQRSTPTAAPLQALVVGNPTMPPPTDDLDAPLQPLQWAEAEAHTIAPLLQTTPLIGAAATKTDIAEQLADADLIHLATHSVLDDRHGLGSKIALAPSEEDDGWLNAQEILEKNLKARLVVLSACDTGRGRITGDGVIGLSRSFIAAGVSSLVVSLWPVSDLSTTFLMEAFYQELAQGKNLSVALKEAQVRLREVNNQEFQEWLKGKKHILQGHFTTEEWKGLVRSFPRDHPVKPFQAPYHWAGFVLIGDTHGHSFPRQNPTAPFQSFQASSDTPQAQEAAELLGQAIDQFQQSVTSLRGDLGQDIADCGHKALTLYGEVSDKVGQAMAHLVIGHGQWLLKQPEIGQQSFEKALGIYQEIGDFTGQALCHLHLGQIQAPRQFTKSLEHFQEALEIYQSISHLIGQATAYKLTGVAEMLSGNLDRAIGFLQTSAHVYKNLQDLQNQTNVLFILGGTYLMATKFDQARDTYQKARLGFETLNNPVGQAVCLYQIASAHDLEQNYQESTRFYQEAQKFLAQNKLNLDDTVQPLLKGLMSTNNKVEDLFIQQFRVTIQVGDIRTPETQITNNLAPLSIPIPLDSANQILKKTSEKLGLPISSGQAELFQNLSKSQGRVGQYQASLDNSWKALEEYKAQQDLAGQADIYFNLCNAYRSVGQNEQSIKYGKKAIKLFQELNDRFKEAWTWQCLGLVQINADQDPWATNRTIQAQEGRIALEQSLRIFQDLDQTLEIALVQSTLGAIDIWFDQAYKQGIDTIQNSLQTCHNLDDDLGKSVCLNHLGIAYFLQGQYEQAIKYQKQSVELIEKQKDPAGLPTALGALGISLLRTNQLELAEKNLRKAIGHWETLRNNPKDILSDENKISLFEIQVNDLYTMIQRVLIAQNRPFEALKIAEQGRARAFTELLAQQFISQDSTKAPDLTLAEIQEVADQQKTTLIQYSIAYNIILNNDIRESIKRPLTHLYIWVIQPGQAISFYPIPLNNYPALTKLVESVRPQVQDPSHPALQKGKSIIPEAEAQLSQLLIAPIASHLPKENQSIVFIPQGILFLVPFAALQTPDGKPLVEQFKISIAPSIQTLQLIRQRSTPTAAPFQALVVGNPTMPLPTDDLDAPLQPLQWAEAEAHTIAPLLQTEPLTGAAATKADIAKQLANADLIHLATHSVLDDRHGLGSKIALAPSPEDDGWLNAQEILDKDLKARLVVLSACDTGRGRITGDGVVGLSRSFIAAGVSSLVVSLWPVSDLSTTFLMEAFYQQLAQGTSLSAALKEAQIRLRDVTNKEFQKWLESKKDILKENFSAEEWRLLLRSFGRKPNATPCKAPYHWAGFITIGAPA
jgi:CHAT domain-containing protein/SpoVK/Ycf46/Vps4 family AAA+-type ATPase